MKTTEASSEFARTKTIKEQREYLPIYTVRDELMSVSATPLLLFLLLSCAPRISVHFVVPPVTLL